MRLENNHLFSFMAAEAGQKKKVLFAIRRWILCYLPKCLFYGIFLFLYVLKLLVWFCFRGLERWLVFSQLLKSWRKSWGKNLIVIETLENVALSNTTVLFASLHIVFNGPNCISDLLAFFLKRQADTCMSFSHSVWDQSGFGRISSVPTTPTIKRRKLGQKCLQVYLR